MSTTATKSPYECSLYTGTDDPSVTPTYGYAGDLYARKLVGSVALYQKTDDGLSTNWSQIIDVSSTGVPLTIGYLQTAGGRNKHTRLVTATPDTPTRLQDHILMVDVAGAAAINLPAGLTGQEIEIKDFSGSAAINNITITPDGIETIDGAANLVINSNYGRARLIFQGTDWAIMNQ